MSENFMFKLDPFPSYCNILYSDSSKSQLYFLMASSTTLSSSFSQPGITCCHVLSPALCQVSRHSTTHLEQQWKKFPASEKAILGGEGLCFLTFAFSVHSPGQNAVPLQFQSKRRLEFMAKLYA